MNLPNKLTLLRIIMIPFFLAAFLLPFIPFGHYAAAFIFAAASFTDFLDGHIARSRNLVTNFGKFADPLADKLLVAAALIAFTGSGDLSVWVTAVLISREFIVTGLRLLAAEKRIILAADFSGKVKTALQMVMIIYILLRFSFPHADTAQNILVAGSVVLSVYSAAEYIIKNRKLFSDTAAGESAQEAEVAALLRERSYTAAFAESCTGGLLSSRLVNVPGASRIFKEGIVSYSNESKIKRLGVLPKTLEEYGAVSAETAAEMAKGAAGFLNCDIGVSVTGIASPAPDTDKETGLVYIGVCIGGKVITKEFRFSGDRQEVRAESAGAALTVLRRELLNGSF